MKKQVRYAAGTAVVLLAVVAANPVAIAAPKSNDSQGADVVILYSDRGNQGCMLQKDGSIHKNPGKLIQYVRRNSQALGYEPHQNPVHWLENFDTWHGTVGDWVRRNCQDLN